MRIRKRLQSLTSTPPDLSSPHSMAAAAVPVAATGAAGGKQGEVVEGGGGQKLYGLGSGSGGGGAAGERGRGLHPNRDLPAQAFRGCTTEPTSPPPSHLVPPDVAAPWGEERSDLAPRGSRFLSGDVPFDHARDGEVPKRQQEGENGGDGDAHRRRNTVAYIGATVAAPKSLGAEAPEPPRGHAGYKGVVAAASSKAKDMAGWGGEARGFPLKKRRGCCRARGTKSVCGDDDEEEEEEAKMVAERQMKPRPSNTRRRGVAASSTTTIGTTAGSTAAQTSVFNGSVGAPTGGAAKKSDDVAVKEEGGDVVSSAATALVDANRCVGNGKKRRSPAVLMEGSRCSRVNGRGWRCCQQTLVGYSLCEHHLGKGRLRSMSSVRCNGRARKKEDVDNGAAPSQLPSPLQQKQHHHQQQQQQQLSMSMSMSGDGDYEEEEEKPSKRRRKKIGMVKARSISSLLHQPDYSTPTAILAAPEPCPSPSPVPATGAVTACASTPLHDSDNVTT